MQNAVPPVVERIAARSAARRHEAYADEVRRLLDAGLAVMQRYGTSRSPRVADIVAEAGLSNDAFYRHFKGKADLVEAILDAGAERLAGYLAHQMAKAAEPDEKVRRFVGGVLAQAGDPAVADATRAVAWNGDQAGAASRREGRTAERLAPLLVPALEELGSPDPERDAEVLAGATLARMEAFLFAGRRPSRADQAHLADFLLAATTRPG